MAGSRYDLFISYRRESGSAEARLIASAFKSRGVRVFLDVEELKGGHFDETLLRTIAESPNFLVILSPHAPDRCGEETDWLRREVAHAISTRRNIIPVIMDGFQFPEELPDSITDLPRYQGVEYSHSFFDATISKIMEGAIDLKASSPTGLKRPILSVATCMALMIIGTFYYWQGYRRKGPSVTIAPSQPNGVLIERRQVAKTDPAVPEPAGNIVKSSTASERVVPQGRLALGTREKDGSEGRTVTYGIKYEGKVTHVFSKLPYLDTVKAGSVSGLMYRNCPFEYQPAGLLVTVLNNTQDDEMLTAVVLNIKSSEPDTEPLVVVDADSTNVLLFTNQGWGDVVEPLVEFTFDEPDDLAALFAPKKQSVRLDTFAEAARIPLKEYLPDDLRSRPFVTISGRIEYGTTNHRVSIRFHTSVRLEVRAGAPASPDTAYDVEYRAGGTGVMTIQLQPRQEIKPGTSAVFLLRMKPDKTCKSRMNIDFLTNEGKTLSGGQFQLDLLVPRCHESSFVQRRIARLE